MKHAVESCPRFNESIRQKYKALVTGEAEVAKKHEVKIISAYAATTEHLTFFIIEAPSQQAAENYFMETGFAFWNSMAIRQVKAIDEVNETL